VRSLVKRKVAQERCFPALQRLVPQAVVCATVYTTQRQKEAELSTAVKVCRVRSTNASKFPLTLVVKVTNLQEQQVLC